MSKLRNDKLYIFFLAFQLALLPLIIAFNLLFNNIVAFLMVVLLIITRFWSEFFKNEYDFKHQVAQMSMDLVIALTLISYAHILGNLSLALTLIAIILYLVFMVLYYIYFKRPQSDLIKALDICAIIFIYLAFLLIYLSAKTISLGRICLISCLICAGVSIGIKTYFLIKHKIAADKNTLYKKAKPNKKTAKKGK